MRRYKPHKGTPTYLELVLRGGIDWSELAVGPLLTERKTLTLTPALTLTLTLNLTLALFLTLILILTLTQFLALALPLAQHQALVPVLLLALVPDTIARTPSWPQ